MTLTQRQHEILKFLLDNHSRFYSSAKLADVFSISSRTIKSEISHIKRYSDDYSSFILETLPGKGIRISIIDNEEFIHDLLNLSSINQTCFDLNENQRKNALMKYLLDNNGYITKEEILEKFYISESTFYKIYNNLKILLEPYNLEIHRSKQRGYHIIGSEKDKRTLISRYELLDKDRHRSNDYSDITTIYNFVADTFFAFEYKVTEPILQNISSHVLIMRDRVKKGKLIDDIEYSALDDKKEYHIAEAICSKFISRYNPTQQQFNNEVHLLTLTILGKINYLIDEAMQTSINEFIEKSYKEIYNKFGINFDTIEKLRLLLVLHLVPLIYRIKSGTQLRNLMYTEVKQQFPHAYDISLYFAILFREDFDLVISPEELSFITLYFNFGIEELNLSKSSKRVLVITHLRTSETVLLRHKLFTWFPNQIMDIKFVMPSEDIEDLEEYDAVFATELYFKSYEDAVTLISIFPDDEDYKKINLALNGYTSADDIIDKFTKECFFFGKGKNKRDVIKKICNNAQTKFDLDSNFFDTIWAREAIASTHFGGLVALPHPLAPSTDETFVSVAVLEEPITWDNDQQAQLIMLIAIERNNPKAFQFWYYISDIIRSSETIKRILKQDNFEDFIDTLRLSLSAIYSDQNK